ncbi:hypothetical protein [Pectinatus haikarae]|uniref:Thiamine kinase-like enzyme n=1 Tax=Pectinatus haikarae TaxID=349096 RepID=A0ABT9Y3K0_9FIRM|nr:hypothetical protein [Pectinatus haikarae]MDQ0202402.1 thiamine kinase-like enzyme [Pectinatus haikarae]
MFEVPEKEDYKADNPHLKTEHITPITVRKPELKKEFQQLRCLIDEKIFENYIETVHNLTKNENTLLITAGNELQKMHIEDCIPALKNAFNVEKVKVIGLMKPFF